MHACIHIYICHIYLYILPFLSLQFLGSRHIRYIRMIDGRRKLLHGRSATGLHASRFCFRARRDARRKEAYHRREKERARYHVVKRALSEITHLVRARRSLGHNSRARTSRCSSRRRQRKPCGWRISHSSLRFFREYVSVHHIPHTRTRTCTYAHQHICTRTHTKAPTLSREFAVRECNKLSFSLSPSFSLPSNTTRARFAFTESRRHTTYIPTHESAATARSRDCTHIDSQTRPRT